MHVFLQTQLNIPKKKTKKKKRFEQIDIKEIFNSICRYMSKIIMTFMIWDEIREHWELSVF